MTRSRCPRVSQGQGAVGTVIKDVGLHPSVLESDIRSFAQVVLVVLKIMSALAGFKNRFGVFKLVFPAGKIGRGLNAEIMVSGTGHLDKILFSSGKYKGGSFLSNEDLINVVPVGEVLHCISVDGQESFDGGGADLQRYCYV
ncbi:hypothetical protein CEXT_445651 [Caerostris extrusa]|uniref:Uncharacterized protein n=1 Tax=Caerostris extrusa TaxID=172846 RepID=A0AAV4QXV8_CAEEX|nr:hypothetical protein CEXT_445651 [Caerostris extrusa]